MAVTASERERILVVDDEPLVTEVVSEILGTDRFVIEGAGSVAEALAALDREPALVVLDKNLPDGSGLAVMYALRKRWPNAEAIIFTGYASYESAVDALRLGAYDYLGKPLKDVDELRRKAHLALERRRFRLERERTLRELQEAQRLQAYAAHSEMMARLGRMLAAMVHDLRSPLTYVSCSIQLAQARLADEGERFAEVLAALDDAGKGIAELEAMTSDVRRVSAVGAFQPERKAVVEVADLVQTAVNLTRCEVHRKAQVQIDRTGHPRVEGSPVRLTQVLVNLLANAAQAMRRFGLIAIRIEEHDGRVKILVEDNGEGMPPEVLARIFEPFFTTKPPEQGSGLGLALSQQIIQEHGGTLRVRSTPGDGSSFTIDLPAAEAVEPTEGVEPAGAVEPAAATRAVAQGVGA
jgi:signal transduction histidine kinase